MANNATGWAELMRGDLIGASFTMYDKAFTAGLVHWFVPLLFFVYQFMLYMKTQNATLCLVTGFFFMSLYVASWFFSAMAGNIIFIILVLELAIIIFLWFFGN